MSSREPTGVRPWSAERTTEIVATHANRRGPLLLVLQALQAEFGYVDERSTPIVAEALNLSQAEVHGVRTFYHDLRPSPVGQTVVRVCTAESCQSLGSAAIVDRLEASFGVAMGETTPDGAVTLGHAFCFGNCALSPAMLVDGTLVGRVEPDEVESLVRSGGQR